jgi:arylsulfatase A-like enzyme
MNVIVIMLDSLRADHLGCYGNDWIKTPAIDQLAGESAIFEHAYSEGIPTLPFRCAAFTGKYTLPRRGWGPLDPLDSTISEVLWNQGYTSALIADTQHMHRPPHSNFARGFDYVQWIRGNEGDAYLVDPNIDVKYDLFENVKSTRGRKNRSTDVVKHRYTRYLRNISQWIDDWWETDENRFVAQVCRAGMQWLENQKKKDNLFLWLDCFDPHEPWDPPKCFQDLYPVPAYSGPPLAWYGGYDDLLSEAEVSHIRALYAADISLCDKWVGILLKKVKDLGMMENTMIILVSDHGEFIGERGLILKEEPWPYEELSQISLIIRHPDGVGKGKKIRAFADSTDLMPTILDFLQVTGPRAKTPAFEATKFIPGASTEEIEGYSLIPVMSGEREKVRDFAISGNFNLSWRIRDEEWSFLMFAAEEHTHRSGPELYKIDNTYKVPAPTEFNREKDWMERENVIHQYPEVAERMELHLNRFLLKYGQGETDYTGRMGTVYFWTPKK